MKNQKKAVALKYPKGAEAPFVVASESGNLAEKIISIAKDCGIPVVEDKNLTEFISVQEVGSAVTEEVWQALACIFATILKK